MIALALVAAAALTLVMRSGGHSPVASIPPPARVTLVYARPVGKGLVPRREVVFAASPAGRDATRLAVGTNPLLSPDGRWVAYDGGGLSSTYKLRLVSPLGGASKAVAALGEPIVWSPDSRSVVVQGNAGADVVEVRGLRVRHLRLPEASGGFSFSPDGSVLAYQHSTGSGSDIFTIDLRSDQIDQLTHDGRSGSPLWGPDGIAFERYGPDRCANCHGDIWLMSRTGSDSHQLTHTHAGIYPAAWSADGTRMLAAYPATHNGRLYAVDVASGAARALTPFVGDLFPQGLSRDGRTVLAAIGCGGTISPYGLVETISFTGGHRTVIVRGPCRASSNF